MRLRILYTLLFVGLITSCRKSQDTAVPDPVPDQSFTVYQARYPIRFVGWTTGSSMGTNYATASFKGKDYLTLSLTFYGGKPTSSKAYKLNDISPGNGDAVISATLNSVDYLNTQASLISKDQFLNVTVDGSATRVEADSLVMLLHYDLFYASPTSCTFLLVDH